MSLYQRAHYAQNRDELLKRLLAFLCNDERFVVAWLVGSLGRNEEDELSDLDLRIVVADAYAERLCTCSPKIAGTITSAERLALYEQFGQPLVLTEAPSFGPTGGCFNHVVYRETAVTVDWVLLPQSGAQIPQQDCRILFDKIGLPSAPPPTPESLEERVQLATRDIGNFWMMMAIGMKYLLRGDFIFWDRVMFGSTYQLLAVKQRIAGEAVHYQRIHVPLAVTRPEQISLTRRLCAEMLEEMPKLVALGGQVPEDPMSIIEVWLSIE